MTRYRDDRYDNRNSQGNQNRDWQNRDWNDDRFRDDRSYGRGDDFNRDQRGMNWDDRQGMGGMDDGDLYFSGQGSRSQGYQGQRYGMGYDRDDARSYGNQGLGGQGYSQRDMHDRYGQQSRSQGQYQGYGVGQGRSDSDFGRSPGSYSGQERGYDWQGLRQAGQQGQGQYGYSMDSQYGAQRSSQGMGSQYGQQSYRGRGPSGYQRSDDRIKEQVNEALEDDHNVDAENITVQLQNGEVTLTGTVSDRQQKRAAEDCVERVRGVKDVHNQLRVQNDRQGQGMQAQSGSQSTLSSMGTSNQSQTGSTDTTTTGTTTRTAKS